MTYQKKTKIVATVGPACNQKDILTKLHLSGVNVFRLNFSHGTHENHAKVIAYIREINQEKNTNIAILQDLQGPKIRTGLVKEDVFLNMGQNFTISTIKNDLGDENCVGTSYKGLTKDVKEGEMILIDDGKIQLKVKNVTESEVQTHVIYGGKLSSNKGINLPNTTISSPSLTKKDIKDLKFGLENDVDWVALSFVRTAEDINKLKKIIQDAGKHTKVVAKIEKPEALLNMEEIIQATDAVMVARGDLGVEIPMQDVPLAQKRLVKKCNEAAKPVIIATQMMESMVENPRPTRAETNDVANAVLDGADAVMLSAESASGKYPIEAVVSMSQIIQSLEKGSRRIHNKFFDDYDLSKTRINDLLIRAACRMADYVEAKIIIGMTKSGYTSFRLSMHRPKSMIFIFTDNRQLMNQMSLIWGVHSFFYDKTDNIDDTLKQIEDILVQKGYLVKGDVYITTSAMPLHWKGHTNMMKVNTVE